MYYVIASLLLISVSFPGVLKGCDIVDNKNQAFVNQLPNSLSDATPDLEEDRKVRFGLKLGAGVSNMNFNKSFPKPTLHVDATRGVGGVVGLLIEVPVYQKFFLQQEYLYTHLTGKAKGEGLTYILGYLSLPVIIKYRATPRLSVGMGGQFDLLLYAKERYESTSTNIIHETEERNIGIAVGMDYRLTDRVSLDARFMHGINHIGMTQKKTNQEFKLELFQFSVVLKPFK
ncbi:porin family protein [Pontibacter sp. HSC-36F09]|uniref:porin family protein n=1 Tax=Pontibacter sp. HSC-36F09 TaxID=2910966 RepID=UPI00209E1C80|nr:porin family protein [Pontibacter sp. HSC-36F09]MCP2045717.1 hypothetical protein [Pontibacter sp. HSC-36F09]